MSIFFWTATGGSAADPTVGANWTSATGTTGTAPGAGDDAYIVPIAGLTLAPINFKDQSGGGTLNSINYASSLLVGTTDTTSANIFGYWKINATTVNISTPDGTAASGGGRVKIWNPLAGATTLNVTQTGSSSDLYSQAVRYLCSNSGTVVNVTAGSVGIATNMPGETATIGTANVIGGSLTLGAGVTWTTANVTAGGTLNTNSAGTTINNASGGNVNTAGAVLIGTVNNYGTAKLNHRIASGVMCTTVNAYNGTTDFSGNAASSTVSTLNKYAGAVIKRNAANPSHITFTASTTVLAGTETIST